LRSFAYELKKTCRGWGSVAGQLMAARALPLRCAAFASANFCTGYA
jgi:hypothetical protein